MKRFFVMSILTLVLVFGVVSTAFGAVGQPPVSGCPVGFAQHMVMEHEHHGHHVGLSVDLNNDGQICVKHLTSGQHVHVDNVVR